MLQKRHEDTWSNLFRHWAVSPATLLMKNMLILNASVNAVNTSINDLDVSPIKTKRTD